MDISTLQRFAKVTGVAMLLSFVFGVIGELVLPGKIIVSGDAAAAAANIIRDPMLVRWMFAACLVEGICDILLCGSGISSCAQAYTGTLFRITTIVMVLQRPGDCVAATKATATRSSPPTCAQGLT